MALSGGAVALPEAVVPDAGAVLASGQAVVSSIDVIEAPAKATVAYTGQAVGTATDETALPAVQAVAVVGQGVTAVEPVIIGAPRKMPCGVSGGAKLDHGSSVMVSLRAE